MKGLRVLSCQNCGHPLTVAAGQRVLTCRYCQSRFYHRSTFPPAVVLEHPLTLAQAKQIVLKGLQDKDMAGDFRKQSFFERGTLYFIPFYQVRGIAARFEHHEIDTQESSYSNERRSLERRAKTWDAAHKGVKPQKPVRSEWVYGSLDHLEPARGLSDLEIGILDLEEVEAIILDSEAKAFDPIDLRKKGVVLTPEKHFPLTSQEGGPRVTVVEQALKVVYLPVWEIDYSHMGIVYKSYVSAADGRLIKIQGLRSNRRKVFLAVLGLFALGTLLARWMKLGWLMFKIVPLLALILTLFGFGIILILFPYFWEVFAFREIVEKSKKLTEFYSIGYGEIALISAVRRVLGKIARLIRMVFKDERTDRP